MTKQELIEYFDTTESVVSTNFPKFATAQLKKGFLITKRGKGATAIYDVEKVEPQVKNKDFFSTVSSEIATDLPGEIWKETFCSSAHEVSNFGRLRRKTTKRLITGNLHNGYLFTELTGGRKLAIHRIVKQTFEPTENFDSMVVDHINGIRTDNCLENLRWATDEENTALMLKNRTEITKETTRLIQKYGYEKTLEILKQIF